MPRRQRTKTLHDRMQLIAGEYSYRELSDLTGTHHETIRRMMQYQDPSIDFVRAICEVFDVSAHWLILGKGPMRMGRVYKR